MRSGKKNIIGKAPRGTWWVRWIDQVELPHRSSQTPQVRVILEKIEGSHQKSLTSNHIFPIPEHKEPIFVDAGMIPLLPIGTIIKEQKIYGFLPSPIKTFSLDTDNSIELSVTKELPDKPQWWRPELPYRPISKKRFPLNEYLNGHCTIFKSDNATLSIPSCEIFRCFYAPISYLANKFLSASCVDHYIEDLIQTSKSFYCEKDKKIDIVVRTGFPSDYKLFLANLLVHPYGRRCLNYLSGSILYKQENLRALIPFRTSSLTILGRCYKLCESTDRYLLYNITHVDWPDDFPRVNYRYDKSNERGKAISPSAKPNPFSQYSPTYYNVDNSSEEPAVILNEEEPSGPNITPIHGLNATWGNQPKESRQTKEHSDSYDNEEKPNPKYSTASEISMGNPFGRKEGVANGEAIPAPADHPITERLTLILKLMVEMNKNPHIISVKNVLPKIVTLTRSGRAAHEFPHEYQKNPKSKINTRLHWSRLQKTKQCEIPRSAFIFEIKDIYNRTTYWIEIESINKNYHSIKYRYNNQTKSTTHEDIKLILTLISRSKGRKKEISTLTQEYLPELNVEFWRHKFISDNKLDHHDASKEILQIGLFDYIKWTSNSSQTQ